MTYEAGRSDAEATAESVAVEREAIAYTLRQVLLASAAGIFAAWLLVALVAPWSGWTVRAIWGSLVTLVDGVIVVGSAVLLRRSDFSSRTRRLIVFQSCLIGVAWGTSPILILGTSDRVPWLFLLIIVIACLATTAVYYSAIPAAFHVFAAPIMLGTTGALLSRHTTSLTLLALGCVVLLAVMLSINYEASTTMTRALTEQHRNATLLTRVRLAEAVSTSIVETAAEAIFTVFPNGIIDGANAAADRLVLAKDGLDGRDLRAFLPGLMAEGTVAEVLGAEMVLYDDGRDEHHVLVSTSHVEATGFMTVIARDITYRKQLERQLAHDATHDALTGLLNRTAVLLRAEHAAHAARRRNSGYALLFVDLDRFKHVNDSMGHAAGDELLRQAAQRISDTIRVIDAAARLGGDEFVALVEDVSDVSQVHRIGSRICEVLEAPFVIAGESTFISASIGLAWSPGGTIEPDALITQADTAMYRAKQNGRRRLVIFDEAMQLWADERADIERALRQAIIGNELELYAQPMMWSDGRLKGMELLARWPRPGHGFVAPAVFIPVAEESGLIVDVGRWALDELGRLLERWAFDDDFASLVGSVNISGLHVKADLVNDVRATFDRYAFPRDRFVIELTETHLMSDLASTRHILESVSGLGVGIAIDDFGTGYSSLAYLASLPSRLIKIDRSFVEHLTTDEKAQALVAAICNLGDAFQRLVVVEGIETEAQRDMAISLGAKVLQGYLFGRPVPISEFESVVRSGAFSAAWPVAPVVVPPRGR